MVLFQPGIYQDRKKITPLYIVQSEPGAAGSGGLKVHSSHCFLEAFSAPETMHISLRISWLKGKRITHAQTPHHQHTHTHTHTEAKGAKPREEKRQKVLLMEKMGRGGCFCACGRVVQGATFRLWSRERRGFKPHQTHIFSPKRNNKKLLIIIDSFRVVGRNSRFHKE